MPTTDDLSPWRGLAGQAERICEAARHDPYEPRLTEEMQALAAELAALQAVGPAGSATLDAAGIELRAAAHAAAAEAWFVIYDSPQALAQFDTALAMLGAEGLRSPGSWAVAGQAECGRGKCLVDLQRSAEAIPALDAAIGWYTAQGDPTDEAQQSMLSQALHTLGLAHADAGDHARALEATARAVELRRRLAEHDVDRYRLALSRSLRNLGNWLNELGRRDEALQSRREMLELRREQWRHGPSTAATLALAQGADILARELVETGRDLDDALALAKESAALYLELDRAHHARFAAALERQMDYLIGLTGGLVNAGMLDQALQVAEAALGLSRTYRTDPNSFAPRLAESLERLSLTLRGQDRRAEAVRAAEEAVGLRRDLAAAGGETLLRELARGLNNLGVMLSDFGRHEQALAAAEEVLELFRVLARANPQAFTPHLARGLNNVGVRLGDLGRREEALAAAEEALKLYRTLACDNPQAFTPDLAKSLTNLGVRQRDVGRREAALAAAEEALALHRELADANPQAFTPDLAKSLGNLAAMQSDLGRPDRALTAIEDAADLYRELTRANPQLFASDLALSLSNLGIALRDLGRREEALGPAMEAVKLYREVAREDPLAFTSGQAMSLRNLGTILRDIGRREEALAATEEALELYRGLARANPQTFTSDLAMSLHNLGAVLSELGRREEAHATAEEAVKLCRALARANPQAFMPDLATSLSNLGGVLRKLGRREEALAAAEEAVELCRALAGVNPQAFTPDLAASLNNQGNMLSDLGRREEALAALEHAAELCRALARANTQAFTPDLARSLDNLGNKLGDLGRHERALAAAREALQLRRALAQANPQAFTPDLVMSLHNLGFCLSALGTRDEALAALRECGARVLQLRPDEPFLWAQLCSGPVRNLDTARDLRDFHLRLLDLLTEHRELAWDSEHAQAFLGLQARAAARAWQLLTSLSPGEGNLVDEAVAALAAALQSPDLARWLEARGTGDGPLAKLAELKREVIEAEQFLAGLRKGLSGGEGSGLRAGFPDSVTEERRAALTEDLERQAAKAQTLRQAFRDERARLVAEDPRFAAAYKPLRPAALRSIAGHAEGEALLCVLEFGADGQPVPSSPERARTVAALLYTDGRRTQLLELQGVSELAWHSRHYAPELGRQRRGALRGAPPAAARAAASAEASVSAAGITDLLAERMSRSFWAPLRQALQESGVAIERLHVCLHGTTQQLPLALRQDDDCPGVQIVPWPGLPYLRRAAMAASAAPATEATKAPSAPWLIGHDCAWASEQPLPMVAVEAALLGDLLQRHGQPVQPIQLAAQLHGQASALVACCHGGAEQAQFDHALHLGAEPLTVRQIVQENIGPPLALLPACHAGRTDEDAAGNALGVAAAFMLSGTKVVSASGKAVPDLLQPWLSTLTVWHAMQGKPHHEAATIARAQFARLEFPEGFRGWLQQALPQALATIQPGGEEDRRIRGARAQLALEQVQQRWPWEGEPQHLFSPDRRQREEATRSVVQGILRPRGGEEGAQALAAEAREMAAFVFVYGVDSQPPPA